VIAHHGSGFRRDFQVKELFMARILRFSQMGDTTILEYDPATADMEEVNRVIAEYERRTGAQPFDMSTGERIGKIEREHDEVVMVHPIAGG
jgi:hypothetical protein